MARERAASNEPRQRSTRSERSYSRDRARSREKYAQKNRRSASRDRNRKHQIHKHKCPTSDSASGRCQSSSKYDDHTKSGSPLSSTRSRSARGYTDDDSRSHYRDRHYTEYTQDKKQLCESRKQKHHAKGAYGSDSDRKTSSSSDEAHDSKFDVKIEPPSPFSTSKSEREAYEKLMREKQQRLKEEKKRLKQLMKEKETPEEKRARRLAKKEAKERKRRQEMGWDEEYAGYTNLDNPFGDSNLLQTFKWNKKLEKEGLKDIDDDELELMNRRKREEQRQELEKVKERRLERERERAERDAAIELEQRMREGAQFEQWAAQEDTFHLQQAKLRSKIRIEDGRAKPIDLLARYISAEEEDFSVDMIEPYLYLNGLSLDDFEDLIADIDVYMRLESKKNQEYWNDIRIIVDEEIRKINNDNTYGNDRSGRSAISTEVSAEIVNIFKGKTPKQLEALKAQIEQKLQDKAPGLDVAYWETLLSRLRSYMARARLRERHEENLRRKLEQLKMEQGVAAKQEESAACCSRGDSNQVGQADASDSQELPEDEEFDPVEACIDEYISGCYTPILLKPGDVEPGTLLIDPEEDEQHREARRKMLRSGGIDALTREEEAFEREARKGMDSQEAQFSVEESLVDFQAYQWSDKWRPRKPRYFNRVHTGFEWNKYNQTHYDIDNPPPKIVQGYKFNIFYPDLIDKNKTPQYFLIPCQDSPDFSVLRFHSGPPYEDIAFKVVNREWEYSYKKGFRCQFHNDIFQLWFHFKRYRYRR